VKMRICSNPVV